MTPAAKPPPIPSRAIGLKEIKLDPYIQLSWTFSAHGDDIANDFDRKAVIEHANTGKHKHNDHLQL